MLSSELKYCFDKVRLASQRFWSVIGVFGIGMISSALMLWAVVQYYHDINYHLPLITKTVEMRSDVRQFHLSLEEFLNGKDSIDLAHIFGNLQTADSLAVQLQLLIPEDTEIRNQPVHYRYLTELDTVRELISQLNRLGTERIEINVAEISGAEAEVIFDEIYQRTVTRIDDLSQSFTEEIAAHKRRFGQLPWMVALLTITVIGLILLIVKNRSDYSTRLVGELRSAEKKVRQFIDTADDMIYWIGLDGSLSNLNPVVYRVTGYSTKDFAQDPLLWRGLTHPDDLKAGEEFFRSHPNGTALREFQYRFKRKDGQWRWMQSKMTGVKDEAGHYVGYNCIDRDITELKNAEKEIEAREKKYHDLVETSQSLIWSIDTKGRLTFVNQAVRTIHGYEPEDVLGRKVCDFAPKNHRAEAEVMTDRILSGQSLKNHETVHVRKDGTNIHLTVNGIALRNSEGKIIGATGTAIDITDQRRAAQTLEIKGKELEKRVKELRCLFDISRIIANPGLAMSEVMQQTLSVIIGAWQSPERIRGRIVFDDMEFTSEKFQISPHVIAADILLESKKAGRLEIFYVGDVPGDDGALFLPEERELLGAAARQLSKYVDRYRAEKERQYNITFLRTVLNSLTHPFYVIDANDYSITMANAAGYRGRSDPQRCYELIHDRTEPCANQGIACPIEIVREHRQPCRLEHQRKNSDGSRSCFETFAYPVFDDKQNVVQIIQYMMDITERKRTELKLNELAAFPEANPNIVLSLNAQGEILYMNPSTLAKLTGLGVAEAEIASCLPDGVHDIIEECISTGRGKENVETHLNGRIISWSFQPVPGQAIVHSYAVDITENVNQAKELRKLSAAVNQSSNMVCITDVSGAIEYVNPFYSQVTGYTFSDVRGKTIRILDRDKLDRRFADNVWKTIKSGETWSGNFNNRRKNGDVYWERVVITPITNESGEITDYLVVSSDITGELKTQQKLIESDKLSAIGTLAAGVAHEFKNYLGGIIGNASFALAELGDDDGLHVAEEALTKIVEMGERANEVAMSLLTYSKSRPEDRKPEDLKKIILRSIALIEKEMKNVSIEVATHFDHVPLVEVSASKIQQLLLNLLINAQHAIKSGGVITVALFGRSEKIEIRVADTGVGIPAENLERIFDPFFSTKGVWGKDEVIGTGMGLAICRNIAREHGGELTVDSVVGIGTTFTVTLPKNLGAEQPIPLDQPFTREIRALIFTLDKSVLSHYYDRACQLGVKILVADDLASVPSDLPAVADIVICDSKFAGKLELLKMVERCRQREIPYAMVNCGSCEYQLADLFDNASANFKELPDLENIVGLIGLERPTTNSQVNNPPVAR